MDNLIWVLILALALPLRAHEFLSNGDFSQGSTNWNGDGQAVSEGNGDPTLPSFNAPTATGLVVTLQPDKWTSISQDFVWDDLKPAWLKMKYATSPDFQTTPIFEDDMGNAVNQIIGFSSKSFLSKSEAEKKWGVTPQAWTRGIFGVCVIVDATHQLTAAFPLQAPSPGQPMAQLQNLNVEGNARTFYLIFAPGKGTITLSKVSIDSEFLKTGLSPKD
jgi:hypothetical protein